MAEDVPRGGSGPRVARHRIRRSASGLRRVEVTVPAADAALVRTMAATLRRGGDEAREVRNALAPVAARARSGQELVAFLRASPLVGEDLVFERDLSVGRAADLEGLEVPAVPE